MMFRVLGPLEVETDDGRVSLPGRRPRALLTALLLQPNSVVPGYRLVEAVWGAEPPDAPTNALQQVVARLRTRLGPVGASIVTRPPGYVLVADDASIDAQRFESGYRAARSTWSTDPARAGALLDEVLRLWRGPAYGEFADGFAHAASVRLEELRVSAVEDRAALFLRSGAATEAIATIRDVMAREPLRERPVELLMRALHADGRAGEALEVFRRYRGLLADELGLDPGPELQALETKILQDDLESARAQRPPPTLPLPVARSAGGAPSNLPAQLTSFVGRAAEVAEVMALLATSRLLTITGPGGAGKTRLALEIAAAVAGDHADGTFFVDLASVTEPALVAPTIAATLGIREEGWEQAVQQALEEHLRPRRLLLVLDNFEQVLDAAIVVAQLLAAAAGLTVLVTSRAALRVRGEQVVPLEPLQVAGPGLDPERASPEDVSRVEAVALFTQRAAAAAPRFALTERNARAVVDLVARLDGLPLAIELAASRSASLAPAAMLQTLERRQPLPAGPRDLPARQQTLRAAIGWSYDLLAAGERCLFRRISVLTGGITTETAAAVCAADIDVPSALTVLADHSLIFPLDPGDPDVRLGMLQTIREFGLDRLDAEDDRVSVERRHAEQFLRLAEDAEPGFRGPELFASMVALETEHENLRVALHWSVEHDEADIGLRIVGALWRFWHLAGHLSEGRRWTAAVLGLPSATGRTIARARALAAAGGLAYWQGDVPAVRAAYEEALEISQEFGDEQSLAQGTYNLAFAYGLVPTKTLSRQLFERSQMMFERVGDAVGVADAQWALAMMAGLAGDHVAARDLADRSVRSHRELGDAFGLVDALSELGRSTRELGELDTARACFLETLQGLASIGYRTAIAITLDNLAVLENRLGNHVRALRLAGAAEALKEAAGGQVPPEFANLPDLRHLARASHTEERIASEWTRGRAMSLREAVEYAGVDPAVERSALGG